MGDARRRAVTAIAMEPLYQHGPRGAPYRQEGLRARGGHYQGTPADTETAYVRQFLAFLGMRDVEFIYAEGLAIGAEHKVKALDAATANIARLAA